MMKTAALFLSATLCGALCAQSAPPWSKGANDPAANKGFIFEVPDVDNVPDLHGNPIGAKLVIFLGGNQFFVQPRLIAGFEKLHPELAGHIFYETLPPGVLRRQMAAGNAVTLGNLTLEIAPDVYEAGTSAVEEMHQLGQLENVVPFATNNLEIMVAAGNPKHIMGLKDLGRSDVRLTMPNVEFEGVSKQIVASLKKAGGDELAKKIYADAPADASNVFLTQIHHRETPMRIMEHESDAGVTWASEVRFQQKIGNPIEGVKIPAAENTIGTYAAAVVTHAPHAFAAAAWIAYLQSAEGQAAYREFGFGPAPAAQGHP
jgi:molybdate transport system substrate-binding protein